MAVKPVDFYWPRYGIAVAHTGLVKRGSYHKDRLPDVEN